MARKHTSPTSKHQKVKEQRAKRKRQQRILTALIITVLALVVVGVIVYPSLKEALTPAGEIVTITPYPHPQADGTAMGDPNAPVKIVNYSDFQCPFCARFATQTEALIVQEYIATGKVYYRFVPYGPGGNYIGTESKDAATAAYCADAQGKFWDYHDILFANHTGENVGDYTQKRLVAFAESLGLDLTQFEACLKSGDFEDKLQAGIDEGKLADIKGTPAFLINGELLTGAQPYEVFKEKIDAALQAAGGS
jgi:protein-disulfide isomerase